jgi:hypothetical protein
MRKRNFMRMLIIICGLLALGCEKETLPTEISTTDQGSIQNAVVYKENFHFKGEVDFTDFFTCAGEEIHFTGSFHWNYHTVMVGENHFHLVFTANDYNISGVGLTSGTKYHEVGATVDVLNVDLEDIVPYEETFTITFDFIGQGPGNNVILKENFHITINANGITTVFFDNFTGECK